MLKAVVDGTEDFIAQMKRYGINIKLAGGETADVGDLVRTIVVNGTMVTRMRRSRVIVPNILPGDVIIGLASDGKATYEKEINSGIGSNGLSSARHDIFNKEVGKKFPETYDHALDKDVFYVGEWNLKDTLSLRYDVPGLKLCGDLPMGKVVLSPTRTYAPVILEVFKKIDRKNISAIIHNSGGGHTKVMKFMNDDTSIHKTFSKAPPDLFRLIQKSLDAPWKEMYQTFNMGYRMEIYCRSKDTASKIIEMAAKFNIVAKQIGTVTGRGKGPKLRIDTINGSFEY